MKFNELGRSMVEMLGVLAIIGVLSVGAIAGYSKAMMKYKLNKQAQQITYMVNSILPLGLSLGLAQSSNNSYEKVSLIPILIKLNLIPLEMVKKNTLDSITDALGNDIVISAVRENDFHYYAMNFALYNTNYSYDSCRNITTAIKAMDELITQINISSWENGTSTNVVRYYGGYNRDCSQSNCIRNMTVSTIDKFCKTCNTSNCSFSILWYES